MLKQIAATNTLNYIQTIPSKKVVCSLLSFLKSGTSVLERILIVYALIAGKKAPSGIWSILNMCASMLLSHHEFDYDYTNVIDKYISSHGYSVGSNITRVITPTNGWHLTLRPFALWYKTNSYKIWMKGNVQEIYAHIPELFDVSIKYRTSMTSGTYNTHYEFNEYPWQSLVIDTLLCNFPQSKLPFVLVVSKPGIGKTTLGLLLNKRIRMMFHNAIDPVTITSVRVTDRYPSNENVKLPSGSSTSPQIVMLNELEINTEKSNSDTGAQVSGKYAFASFMDVPVSWCFVIATSNQPLNKFEDWLLRRFSFWVEVTEDDCRIHHNTKYGEAPDKLLYSG
jgi:hypothetical protein